MRKTFLFTAFLTIFAAVVLWGSSARAAEKEITFELGSTYEACAFTVSVEKEGEYDVTLVPPTGDECVGKIDGGVSCEILAKNVRPGKYLIRVQTVEKEVLVEDEPAVSVEPDAPSEETPDTETPGEEVEPVEEELPEEALEEEIGKVKISVRAIDMSSYRIDEIKVAKDIAGLKMYFVDDSIVVEWADSAGDRVTVIVTDTQTQQTIGKETVDSHSFTCDIPGGVTEITVSVFPSTSNNIEEAGAQYTLEVDNHPDAIVYYENRVYTNQMTTSVVVSMKDSYGLKFVNNGSTVKEVPIMEAGEYTYDIPVVEGSNIIQTYVVDSDGNMRSTPYEIIRDSVMPTLRLDMDYNGIQYYDEAISLDGHVNDFSSFTINDEEIDVYGDGRFNKVYNLHDGDNKIIFKAVDEAGNETIYEAVIQKLERKKSIPPVVFAGIGVLIVVGLFFLYKKMKNRGGADSKPKKPAKAKEKKEKPVREKKKAKFSLKELTPLQCNLLLLVGFALVCCIFFKFVLIPGYVPSDSMSPTLNQGDYTVANGLAYVLREPQRGDIVVFWSDEFDQMMVKRVIGIPGDEISFHDGYVYINGNIQYEPYIDPDIETNSPKVFTVPEKAYFMLGDNRENSLDSRFWQSPFISKGKIAGKYLGTLFHVDK